MNKYAIIPLEIFNIDMLNGVKYPVCIEMEKWKMLEYTTESSPTGEGWVVFDGNDSNKAVSKYIAEN